MLQRGATIAELVQVTSERSGILAELEADRSIEALGRVDNVKELATDAAEYAKGFLDASLDDFLTQVALVSEQDDYDEESSSVSLMTLHNAKGLEFPVVFLLGMEDGVFPHIRSLANPDELEEERRLVLDADNMKADYLQSLHEFQEHFRSDCQRPGDGYPLSLTPAELMGILLDKLLGGTQAHAIEQG